MENLKIPVYAKTALILTGIFVFISILFIAQDIIIPIVYAAIAAIVLGPMVRIMERYLKSRVVAIFFSLLLVFLVAILLVLLLSSQLRFFAASFPKMLDKFYLTLDHTVVWASGNFTIDANKINGFIADTKNDLLNSSRSVIGTTLNRIGNTLVVLVLIPVYVFMMLYYQPLLMEFIQQLFGKKNEKEVAEVLGSTKNIIQR